MTCEMRELGVVRVARPCPASWAKMVGDDEVRFCALCGLNVYNLSALDADEARERIRARELSRAWSGGSVLAIVAAVLFWVVSLLGENVRRLNAMSGQLATTQEKR